MTHPQEHTLERYVLGDPGVGAWREEIELHLRECAGCRSIAESMRSFHEELDAEMRSLPVETDADSLAIVRRRGGLAAPLEDDLMAGIHRPLTLRYVVRHLVRRHPVATGAASLFSLALLALLLNRALVEPQAPPAKDSEIATANVNEATGMFEVRNARSEVLWSKMVKSAATVKEEEKTMGYRFKIRDADGDGHADIVTSLTFEESEPGRGSGIRIFDRHGRSLKQFAFQRDFRVSGFPYVDEPWTANFPLIINDFDGDGRDEILTIIGSGRSATAVVRYDLEGRLLGEYWHYGSLWGAYEATRNGRPIILACGLSDIDEPEHGFPVVLALDPSRISGLARANSARGFDFPPSDAELCYLRLPRTSLHQRYLVNAHVTWLEVRSASIRAALSFKAGGRVQDYYVILSNDLVPQEMDLSTTTMQEYEMLIGDGTLPPGSRESDERLFLSGVRYWDGASWGPRPIWRDGLRVNP